MRFAGQVMVLVGGLWGGALYLNFWLQTQPLVQEARDNVKELQRAKKRKASTIKQEFRNTSLASSYEKRSGDFLDGIGLPAVVFTSGFVLWILSRSWRRIAPDKNDWEENVIIRSSNAKRAVIYYEMLGLEFILQSHDKASEYYKAETNGRVFEVFSESCESVNPTTGRIQIQVTDVVSSFKSIVELGAEIVDTPQDSKMGRRAVVKDLDGHTVELIESNG